MNKAQLAPPTPAERKSRTEKQCKHFSNSASENRQTIIHEKVPFFLDMELLVNESSNPPSNLTWRKVCFVSIE
jgi:hypothetical protein